MDQKCFASDNFAGIHPEVMAAIMEANNGHAAAYGSDLYTEKAIAQFKSVFGQDIEVFFVLNGTAANVMSILSCNKSFQAVICTEKAHIQVDECGAGEKWTGSKLLVVPTTNGKLTIEHIKKHMQRIGDQHHVQPHLISISQSTEYGTVYSVAEIKAIADFAHQHNMLLHMDGARISNAAVSLNLDLRAMTRDAGVDVLSFGGTKNGMMLGEAVVFFNQALAKDFLYIRKQSMQLASKMRFISAQFSAMLTNDLWKRNASHANKMARLLADKLSGIDGIKITQEVQANAVFAVMPKELIAKLQETMFFYVWDELTSEVRLMMSFDTNEEEVNAFVASAHLHLVVPRDDEGSIVN